MSRPFATLPRYSSIRTSYWSVMREMRWEMVSSTACFQYALTYSSPVCDSYVRPETLVRICDECNFGTYGGRCIICGSPGTLLYSHGNYD